MEIGESLVPRPAVCWLNSELYGVAVTGRGPALCGTLQLQVLQLLENYAIFVHAYGLSAGPGHSTRRPSFSGSGLLPPKTVLCHMPVPGAILPKAGKELAYAVISPAFDLLLLLALPMAGPSNDNL